VRRQEKDFKKKSSHRVHMGAGETNVGKVVNLRKHKSAAAFYKAFLEARGRICRRGPALRIHTLLEIQN